MEQILVVEHNLVLISTNRLSQLSNPENNSMPESNSREHLGFSEVFARVFLLSTLSWRAIDFRERE